MTVTDHSSADDGSLQTSNASELPVVPEVFVSVEAGDGKTASSISPFDVSNETRASTALLPRDANIDLPLVGVQGTLGPPPALSNVSYHNVRLNRKRTRRHSPKVNLPLLAVLFATVFIVFSRITSDRQTLLNYALSILWSAYAPLMIIGVIGAFYIRMHDGRGRNGTSEDDVPLGSDAERQTRNERHKPLRSEFSGRTDRLLVVTVPTLLSEGNLAALQRVLFSLLVHLPRHFNRFHVDVITEGDVNLKPLTDWLDKNRDLSGPVRIVNVPRHYGTENRARFKTRANQCAMESRRFAGENTEECFVYHLDDDTHIGRDTAASLAEFIELDSNRFFLAQGILAFPHELTPSRICRLADAIRPADDLSRLAFFTGAMGTPLGGLHGEHLIVRADIEDEIGWDFPNTVIEDAYFAIRFSMKYPHRSTMLNFILIWSIACFRPGSDPTTAQVD